MERTRRQITLAPFRGKNSVRWNVLSGGTVTNAVNSWGKMCCDVLIPDDIADGHEYSYGIGTDRDGGESVTFTEKRNVMRYSDVLSNHHRLKSIIDGAEGYRICRRRNTTVWVRDYSASFTDENFEILPELPEPTHEIGRTVMIIPNIDDFNLYYDGNRRYANGLYQFLDDLLKGNGGDVSFSMPYAALNISLRSHTRDMGMMSSYAPSWESGKRYRLADRVRYGEDVYELFRGETLEQVKLYGAFADLTSTTESIMNNFVLQGNGYYVLGGEGGADLEHTAVYKGMLSIPCYRGTMDEDGLIATPAADTVHWKAVSSDVPMHEVASVFTESRLSDFIRRKKSYGYDGDLMPFIYEDGNVSLPYALGFSSAEKDSDGTVRGNCLSSIVTDGASVSYHRGDSPNVVSAVFTDGKEPTEIEFTYMIDCVMEGNNDTPRENEGTVTYTETHRCSVVRGYSFIDERGNRRTVDYLKIETPSLETDEGWNYRDDGRNPVLARAEYHPEGFLGGPSVAYRGKGSLIGLQDEKDSVDGSVSRGIASLSERIYALCEVKTVEALANYKNGFFGF